MMNCGAIVTRSGRFDGSTRAVLRCGGIWAQRRSWIHVVLDRTRASRSSVPSLRKIHTNLAARCSTCSSDAEKKIPPDAVSKKITERRSGGWEELEDGAAEPRIAAHKVHARGKEHELKIGQAEKLYPNPRGKLHDVYQSVEAQLGRSNLMVIRIEPPRHIRHLWSCTYTFEWPEKAIHVGTASSKVGAAKAAALKSLQWLHNTGKLKNGLPVVFDSRAVVEMLKKPTPIAVEPETLESLRNLLRVYREEIREIAESSSSGEEWGRDISVPDGEPSDPVGRSSNIGDVARRNALLARRLAERRGRGAAGTTSLPIASYRDRIVEEIAGNRALLIKGDTGCGKTTQVPQYVMDSFAAEGRATECNVIISQPRRISAVSLAERIAHERGERPGDVVGYQVRLEQLLPSTPGGMLFCTTGILLKKLQSNPSLEGCSHVILDEAHERSINTDMLLVLLKRALSRNPRLKVVVMSATINADLFQRYFDCGVVEVPGRTFPVEMRFLEDVHALGIAQRREYAREGDAASSEAASLSPLVDHEQIGELVRWIDANKPPGAILCFLPGWSDIVRVKNYLEENRRRGARDTIIPLHSRVSHRDQRRIFDRAPEGSRKIVLATDIAETGITIADVVYVVDSAMQKAMRWHEKRGLASMDNQYASRANILQRKGRAGRVQPGESYHLVTRAHFDKLPEHPLPEVLRSSLEQTVLDCKTYSDERAESFLGSMPQPPTPSAVRKAIDDLVRLGALDDDENLTPLGKRIALFSVHPKLSKAIVYSSIFRCVSPIVTIASAASADSEVFVGTLFNKEALRAIKKKYHPASDHLSLGWMYAQWASINARGGREAAANFCWKTKLHPERVYTLSKVRDIHAESLAQCRMLRDSEEYDDPSSDCNEYRDLDELVRGVLLAGLDQLLHHRDFELKKYRVKKGTSVFVMDDGNRATVTPDSVNFKRKRWPSPFLTYVRSQHSEERRSWIIRDTSMVSPVTALLFSQGRIHGYQTSERNKLDDSEATMVLEIKGRKNFRLVCDVEVARVLLEFRDSMWSVVRYFVERYGFVDDASGKDYHKILNFRQYMLQVLAKLLSEAAREIDKPEAPLESEKSGSKLMSDEDEDEE